MESPDIWLNCPSLELTHAKMMEESRRFQWLLMCILLNDLTVFDDNYIAGGGLVGNKDARVREDGAGDG